MADACASGEVVGGTISKWPLSCESFAFASVGEGDYGWSSTIDAEIGGEVGGGFWVDEDVGGFDGFGNTAIGVLNGKGNGEVAGTFKSMGGVGGSGNNVSIVHVPSVFGDSGIAGNGSVGEGHGFSLADGSRATWEVGGGWFEGHNKLCFGGWIFVSRRIGNREFDGVFSWVGIACRWVFEGADIAIAQVPRPSNDGSGGEVGKLNGKGCTTFIVCRAEIWLSNQRIAARDDGETGQYEAQYSSHF